MYTIHTHVYLFHIYAHVCTRVKETMLIPCILFGAHIHMRMHAQLRMYARFKETLLVPCILLGAHHILAGQAHCDSSVVEVPHLQLGRNVMMTMTCTLTLTLWLTLMMTLTSITMMVMNVMMIPPSLKFLKERHDVRENKNDDDDVDNNGESDPYVKAPLYCQHENKDDEDEEVEKIND